jgi:hypothetical protein
MPAVKQDIKIEEGVNFQMVVDASGYEGSLAGATARMEVRDHREDDVVLLAHTPEVNSGTKQVIVNISYTELEPLDWRHGEYDIELTVAGERYRLTEGRVVVSPQVTRS